MKNIILNFVVGGCQSLQCLSKRSRISAMWCGWYDEIGLSAWARGFAQFKMSIWHEWDICEYKSGSPFYLFQVFVDSCWTRQLFLLSFLNAWFFLAPPAKCPLGSSAHAFFWFLRCAICFTCEAKLPNCVSRLIQGIYW